MYVGRCSSVQFCSHCRDIVILSLHTCYYTPTQMLIHPVLGPCVQVACALLIYFTPYHVQDAFRQDNEIQLIARSNGRPIRVHNCKFMGNGNYADGCERILCVLHIHFCPLHNDTMQCSILYKFMNRLSNNLLCCPIWIYTVHM